VHAAGELRFDGEIRLDRGKQGSERVEHGLGFLLPPSSSLGRSDAARTEAQRVAGERGSKTAANAVTATDRPVAAATQATERTPCASPWVVQACIRAWLKSLSVGLPLGVNSTSAGYVRSTSALASRAAP